MCRKELADRGDSSFFSRDWFLGIAVGVQFVLVVKLEITEIDCLDLGFYGTFQAITNFKQIFRA